MNISLTKKDIDGLVRHYEDRYKQYGYSQKTLDWDKGKQDIRFSLLTSRFDLRNKRIVDIGCGFGDLNTTLQRQYGDEYSYFGIDVVPSFINEATTRYGNDRVAFHCGNYLEMDMEPFDYAFCSGMFNLKMTSTDNMEFIRSVFEKTYQSCREGFAFNFLSDKVDYTKENTFHSSPESILALGYSYSRNVAIDNSYMPFEFSFFLRKDDSFDPSLTIFKLFLKELP